ncbi:MAG: hypothetical protein P4L81_02525, partial [Candidatus Pacebacteria bacterium]|nr:hypothetical protein [Candidatus Paceibacterota bacterium]
AVAAFTVEDSAEVDFGVVAEALPDVASTEEALVSRAAAIEGVAMVAATATVAMVVVGYGYDDYGPGIVGGLIAGSLFGAGLGYGGCYDGNYAYSGCNYGY